MNIQVFLQKLTEFHNTIIKSHMYAYYIKYYIYKYKFNAIEKRASHT